MPSSIETVLRPIIYLSMIGGVSTSLRPQKLPILSIIVHSLILVLNFVHFVFIPFGIMYIEKVSKIKCTFLCMEINL